MIRTHRLAATAALGLTLSLVTACGGDDEADPIPGATESETTPAPEVSVSPPPTDVPDLDEDQQAAFDAAVARYADFQEFTGRVAEDPDTSQAIADKLLTYTVEPASTNWAASLDQLIEDGIYIEGRRQVEWTVPIAVSGDQVVFRQCESPGDWTAYQGDESSPQTNNIVTEVTAVEVDQWRIKDQKGVGEC